MSKTRRCQTIPSGRRGMLLLMVLLMLSLFMAIGALLLTVGLRARSAVRAYGDAATSTSANDNLARAVLDDALLQALRGGTNGSVTINGTTPALENLLADKYGSPLITGSGVLQSATGTPLLTLSSTSPGIAAVANRLSGRVLTTAPNASDGDTASFRILSATTGSGTTSIHLANIPTATIRKLPTGTSTFVINGREFTPLTGTSGPETYDAYDPENNWLAQPLLSLGQVSRFDRLSFSGTASPPVVDNDNDGVLDGVWIPSDATIASAIAAGTITPAPVVISDRPSPLGGTLRFQVSYLILDLDGRININAAGMALPSPAAYPSDAAGPLGMGYGPADIDASLLFPPALPVSGTNKGSPFTGSGATQFVGSGTTQFANTTLSGSIPLSGTTTRLKWPQLLIAGTSPPANPNPQPYQRRAPVSIGPNIGRYGIDREPGLPNVDDNDPFQTTTGTGGYSWTASGPNSFADLQGRRMVFIRPPAAGAITPTLVASSTATDLVSAALSEDAIDDPYESRLDGTSNNDATFSIAELERILRANDPDALQLPQRLAAGLEDAAQISRMTITTDSWDTPALTGLAARRIEDSLANSTLIPPLIYSGTAWRSGTTAASNAISPDIAAGLRFNINRPAATDAEKQEFCKGLYTLAMLLGGTNAQTAAQWAANVMDFRDQDDSPTRFAYDTTLADGWVTTGTNVVWGVERPEVVITETAAWADSTSGSSQLFVTLHRPASLTTLTGTPNPVSGTASLSLNGWQIRFDQSNASSQAVNLLSGSATASVPQTVAGNATAFNTTVHSGSSTTLQLTASGTGSYLCVHPTGPSTFTPSGVPTLQVGGGVFALPPNATSGTVTLERLSNPALTHSSTNPYIVVDRAPIEVIQLPAQPNQIRKKQRPGPNDLTDTFPNNLTAFWNNPFKRTGIASNPLVVWEMPATTTLGQYSITATRPVPWFHWPNRPFISNAELALVPADDAAGLLENYSFPSTSLVNNLTSVTISGTTRPLGELLLEAIHVPSRFAGNSVTVSGTSVDRFGLDLLQLSTSTNAQLSKWREPGKVNVNTVVRGITRTSGADATTDDVVWTTLLNNVFFANPFTPKPAVTQTIPGVPAIPASTGNPTVPGVPAIPGNTPLEPAQPAQSTLAMLSVGGTSANAISFQNFLVSGSLAPRDRNPFFAYAQAIRLANTATIRSQVFAVWITVRITDDSPNAPSPVTKRMFAIIDRSIPVGYAPGQDLNVRDTIRLKRYLD